LLKKGEGMLNQQLREEENIIIGKKMDQIHIQSLPNKITFKKTATKKTALGYFFSFLLLCIVIGFFGYPSWIIIALSAAISLSLFMVVFLKYITVFDFQKEQFFHQKMLGRFTFSRTFDLKQILDFKVKGGEMGYNIKIKTGTSDVFFYKIWQELTFCRVETLDDAQEIINWLREKIKPQ